MIQVTIAPSGRVVLTVVAVCAAATLWHVNEPAGAGGQPRRTDGTAQDQSLPWKHTSIAHAGTGFPDCNENDIPDEEERVAGIELFVCNRGSDSVSLFDLNTGNALGFFVPPGGGPNFSLDFAHHVEFSANGNVFISSTLTNSVIEFNGVTGNLVRFFSDSDLELPAGLLFLDMDTLLVASWGNDRILALDVSSEHFSTFVPYQEGGLVGPTDMLLTPWGTLLVGSQRGNSRIIEFGLDGSFIRVFVDSTQLGASPTGMVFDAQDDLLVGVHLQNRIQRYHGTATDVAQPLDDFVEPDVFGLAGPQGLAWGPDRQLLYVASDRTGATGKILIFQADDGTLVQSLPIVTSDPEFVDRPHYLGVRPTRIIRDCQPNGILDVCDIADCPAGDLTCQDCNENGIPDACDIENKTSEDCTFNDVPDDCEPDCNDNGRADSCDILFGSALDTNQNGVPDECDDLSVLFVDHSSTGANNGTNWANAFVKLRDAFDATGAANGRVKEIRVAEGVYRPAPPGGSQAATFELIHGVDLYGGFAGLANPDTPDERDIEVFRSILSGDLNDDDTPGGGKTDNAFHVVTARAPVIAAILDGFTITGGNASGSTFSDSIGGGIFSDGGSPTIRNCSVQGNSASRGGGMANIGGAMPLVESCRFSQNTATSFNGGASLSFNGSSSQYVNCEFVENRANQNGGAISNGSATSLFVNCLFVGNRAGQQGGAIHLFNQGDLTLANCTLSANHADIQGGGIYADSGTSTVANCVFFSDSADEDAEIAGDTTVTFSLVQGGFAGIGNIDADPIFVRDPDDGGDGFGDDPSTPDVDEGANDDLGDLRLLVDSPAIDVGSNEAVLDMSTDLDGANRIIDGDSDGSPVVDIGAYEFIPASTEDCNENGLLDIMEICPPGDATCPPPKGCKECDCNGNGKLDCCELDSPECGLPLNARLGRLSVWIGEQDELWSTEANWCPREVPDNTRDGKQYTVRIGPDATVRLEEHVSVSKLRLSESAALLIEANGGLEVEDEDGLENLGQITMNTANVEVQAGGKVTNDGIIKIGGAGGQGARFFPREDSPEMTLMSRSGNGKVMLESDTAELGFGTEIETRRIENMEGHIIQGAGQIKGIVHNAGLILADGAIGSGILKFDRFDKLNQGTIQTVRGGEVVVVGLIHNVGGAIVAADGPIFLKREDGFNATIVGGTLRVDPRSSPITLSGEATIKNLRIEGRVVVADEETALIEGTIDNDGSLEISAEESKIVAIGEEVLLTGAGTLFLNTAESILESSQLQKTPTLLINDVGHTIAGIGSIRADIVNNGTIQAFSRIGSVDDLQIVPVSTFENNGTMLASRPVTMRLDGPIHNTGVITATSGGTVVINANVTGTGGLRAAGGTIQIEVDVAGSGLLMADNGTVIINDVDTTFSKVTIAGFGLKSELLVDGDAQINISEALEVSGVGTYKAVEFPSDPLTAALTAESVLGTGSCPIIALTGSMSLTTTGDFEIGTKSSDQMAVGGCDPPGFPGMTAGETSQMQIGGNFLIYESAIIEYTSSIPMMLAGDFVNQSVRPDLFHWESGGLILNGIAAEARTLEK
ncbi:MAG: choice-of-anchor Q domain-containing protein, partial [Phycisphaerae bacterium]